MTGHVSFGPPPQTVPVLPAYIPVDVDMTMIKAQVAATGVSAPPAAMPGLLEVVNQAHGDGINLKIVLLDHNPRTTPRCATSRPWSAPTTTTPPS